MGFTDGDTAAAAAPAPSSETAPLLAAETEGGAPLPPVVSADRCVAATGLSPECERQHLEDFFCFCGDVSDVVFSGDPASRRAVVTFVDPAAVETALMLTGASVAGRPITVSQVRVVDGAAGGGGEKVDRVVEGAGQRVKSAQEVVTDIIQAGYVHGEGLVAMLRAKAEAFDREHNVRGRAASAVRGVSGEPRDGTAQSGTTGGGVRDLAGGVVGAAQQVGGAIVSGVKDRLQGPQPTQDAQREYQTAGARQWNPTAVSTQPQW